MPKRFPFYRQLDSMDCGPTCLRMVASHYGRDYTLTTLREYSYIDKEGVSLRGIAESAERIGLRTLAVRLPFESRDAEQPGLMEAPLPAIVHWKQRHFVVVYHISKHKVWVADPAVGQVQLSYAAFRKGWCSDADNGLALLLEPTPDFYNYPGESIDKTRLSYLWRYLLPYKRLIWQLVLGLLLGSVFQLLFPLLTQSIVDIGIRQTDLNFIYLILFGQLMLFLGQVTVQVVQSWILLHIGARVNVSLLTDFLGKLMRLPLQYFDSRHTGDLLQRIADQRRIEAFLTQSTLSVVFSLFQLLVFGIVLLYYSVSILALFVAGSLFYVGWILLFMKKRALVDHQRFVEQAENQSALVELLQGMPEIKLQHSERRRRWNWAQIQARLFRANVRLLTLTQYQDSGAAFINQLKDILITFVAAKSVITGDFTLGMMLAVQYMAGQLNVPLQQLIGFLRSAQDARLSFERLGEIQQHEDEEPEGRVVAEILPLEGDIVIENLSFQYNPLADFALKDVSLQIPQGKVTAIVGASGSGKTTLIKLLLGFYEVAGGKIKVGGLPLQQLSKRLWRSKCGAVLQDGFIFSDSIARNIAESADDIDNERLFHAAEVANIREFVTSLPLGYNTKVGARGNGLSQGQRQRLLIARAVYKSPDYIFFDEATNALDATNERVILDNLRQFFQGRTVVVVAHRLSTVKDADQIAVLDKGRIVELGTHQELTRLKGAYYQLVKNQLELGS